MPSLGAMSPTRNMSRAGSSERGGQDSAGGGSSLDRTLCFGQVVHDRHHDAPRYRVRSTIAPNTQIRASHFPMSSDWSDTHIASTAIRYMWSDMLQTTMLVAREGEVGLGSFTSQGSGSAFPTESEKIKLHPGKHGDFVIDPSRSFLCL
jgi:hypothetical protein